VEGVEHAEGRRRQAQREPDRRGGFLAREGKAGGEQIGDPAASPSTMPPMRLLPASGRWRAA